ncbi:MAG: Ig-like domain-containing protein [Thiobacillus sp.]|nr:Ig-like domain-containing protein [Thiobacillus sp.]
MKTRFLPISRMAQALALAGLSSFPPAASAVEYWLRAEPLTVSMPGSVNVPMWGYALDGTSCPTEPATPCQASVPGPTLTVPVGDPLLTVHLKNNLLASTSIVIPGQAATMAPVKFTDPTGRARVRSFTHETLGGGGTADYSWSSMKPGTYLYHSGTHPQVQVQMGLYGGVKKDFAVGEAYSGVLYSNEVSLLYSEIDPALHTAVAGGTYGTLSGPTSTLDYQPRYFLINGKPYQSGDPAVATLTAGQPTLLRFLNAGLQTHVPVINGMSMRLIAEDGNPYPWPANPREQYSVMLPAAKTIDTIIVPHAVAGETTTRYPIYDRRMGLSNDGSPDGGMLAFLDVGGGGSAPAFTSTPVTTATQNAAYSYTLAASDTDGGVLNYSLDVKPTGMSVNAGTGIISWTPSSAQVGTQAVTARVTDPTGLFATQSFSIAVADANDPPVAQNNAYTMIRRGTLNIAAPGILANDSDPDAGDTLSAVNFGALTPSGGTLVRNANGSFSFTPPLAYTGTKSFSYQAQDSSSATSNVATVSITVIANRPPLAVDDTVAAPVRRSTPPYVPVVISVLVNDSDPDTAIDPANVINPASVTISSAPNKGGSVVVNANGTIAYTPRLNFRGTETFRYRVQDTYITPATSNAAYVRVNVQ